MRGKKKNYYMETKQHATRKQMGQQIKKEIRENLETPTERMNFYGCQGEGWGKGQLGSLGWTCTHCYIETLLNVIWQPGWKGSLGENRCMEELLPCSPETIKTLLISHIPTQNKKIKNEYLETNNNDNTTMQSLRMQQKQFLEGS